MNKRLLWIGDGPDCPSGFGLATRKTLESLDSHFGGPYDVTVLGINYRGDPGTVPYPVYAAAASGDMLGVSRLIWMCDRFEPDIIVLQNDPWQIPNYLRTLRSAPEHLHIPVVASLAIDGKNMHGAQHLSSLAMAVFWTQFGLKEARRGGYVGKGLVIPLGVDRTVYYPVDKREARERRGLKSIADKFIVGNVNRNQPRKRWDLTIEYFAEWIKSRKIKDAYLYLHTAPTGDVGCDVKQLMRYYGILNYLVMYEPPIWYGAGEDHMRDTYSSFDVQISTTQGEGFGLTTLEGMACGVPQIVPDWSALGEWAKPVSWSVPCTSTSIGWPYLNVIGGIPDKELFIHGLDTLYRNRGDRESFSRLGLDLVSDERFSWGSIGRRWVEMLDTLSARPIDIEWKDAGPIEEEVTT